MTLWQGLCGEQATYQQREKDAQHLQCAATGGPHGKSPHLIHRKSVRYFLTQISTRRFFSRPASVSLEATGRSEPKPLTTPRLRPFCLNSSSTACARLSEIAWLAFAVPALSAKPKSMTLLPE